MSSARARTFNFSAGPSALPLAALERAQAELTDYAGTGISVLEMSHRAPEFERILAYARREWEGGRQREREGGREKREERRGTRLRSMRLTQTRARG